MLPLSWPTLTSTMKLCMLDFISITIHLPVHRASWMDIQSTHLTLPLSQPVLTPWRLAKLMLCQFQLILLYICEGTEWRFSYSTSLCGISNPTLPYPFVASVFLTSRSVVTQSPSTDHQSRCHVTDSDVATKWWTTDILIHHHWTQHHDRWSTKQQTTRWWHYDDTRTMMGQPVDCTVCTLLTSTLLSL